MDACEALAPHEDIPEHRAWRGGKTAIALKKREKDIIIYYRDTRPNVWEALKRDLQDDYVLSVSIAWDSICLQLSPRTSKECVDRISRSLAQMMADAIQRITVEKMICSIQSIQSRETLDMLVMLCMARAAQKGYSRANAGYVEAIEKRIEDCLTAHRRIHLDGFMTFRMRDYTSCWKQCVEDVMEVVCEQAEYDAYMDILRRFYRAQPCRCQNAVVYETATGYAILADGRPIRIARHDLLRNMQSPEETLMHLLLQLAPAHIEVNLFTEPQQRTVISALLLVFGAVVDIREHRD
jgi:hypothetical protein